MGLGLTAHAVTCKLHDNAMATILPATDCGPLYRSRGYWEQVFAELGLWPSFMAGDRTAHSLSWLLDAHFPELQFVAVSGTVSRSAVGIAHSVPVTTDLHLSDRGWDWALEDACATADQPERAKALCGLSITVLPPYQRQGIARAFLLTMIEAAISRNYSSLIVPVRPTGYGQSTGTSFSAYVSQRREDGLPVDPWLRQHVKLGGKLCGICHNSMTIVGTRSQWKEWTRQTIEGNKLFWPQGALAAVIRNPETDQWEYSEPNVWVRYEFAQPRRSGNE